MASNLRSRAKAKTQLQQQSPKGSTDRSDATPPPLPSEKDNDDRIKCAICLGDLVNRSFSNSCVHQFCFGCLLEWSKVKPECPLCKSSFTSIKHNFRSTSDYDEYHVPPVIRTPPIPHMLNVPYFHHIHQIEDDIMALRSHRFHPYGPSTAIAPQLSYHHLRSRSHQFNFRIFEYVPSIERRTEYSNPFRNGQTEYFGTSINLHNNDPSSTSTITNYQARRRIYDRNQWVTPFGTTLQEGSFMFPSVEYIQTHPTARSRIMSWLHREITVLLGLQMSMAEMASVFDVIMNVLENYDIRSRPFRELVISFFGSKTPHFQHEFYHFVISGMGLDEYDLRASYTMNQPGTSADARGVYSPPPVVTIDDSSDDDISNLRHPPPSQQHPLQPTESAEDPECILIQPDNHSHNSYNPSTSSSAMATNSSSLTDVPWDLTVGNASMSGLNAIMHRELRQYQQTLSRMSGIAENPASDAASGGADAEIERRNRSGPRDFFSWGTAGSSTSSSSRSNQPFSSSVISMDRHRRACHGHGNSHTHGHGHWRLGSYLDLPLREAGARRSNRSRPSRTSRHLPEFNYNPRGECINEGTSGSGPPTSDRIIPSIDIEIDLDQDIIEPIRETEHSSSDVVNLSVRENSIGNENNEENENDCVLLGVHPVVKKPPLAVITISDSSDEGGARSGAPQNQSVFMDSGGGIQNPRPTHKQESRCKYEVVESVDPDISVEDHFINYRPGHCRSDSQDDYRLTDTLLISTSSSSTSSPSTSPSFSSTNNNSLPVYLRKLSSFSSATAPIASSSASALSRLRSHASVQPYSAIPSPASSSATAGSSIRLRLLDSKKPKSTSKHKKSSSSSSKKSRSRKRSSASKKKRNRSPSVSSTDELEGSWLRKRKAGSSNRKIKKKKFKESSERIFLTSEDSDSSSTSTASDVVLSSGLSDSDSSSTIPWKKLKHGKSAKLKSKSREIPKLKLRKSHHKTKSKNKSSSGKKSSSSISSRHRRHHNRHSSKAHPLSKEYVSSSDDSVSTPGSSRIPTTSCAALGIDQLLSGTSRLNNSSGASMSGRFGTGTNAPTLHAVTTDPVSTSAPGTVTPSSNGLNDFPDSLMLHSDSSRGSSRYNLDNIVDAALQLEGLGAELNHLVNEVASNDGLPGVFPEPSSSSIPGSASNTGFHDVIGEDVTNMETDRSVWEGDDLRDLAPTASAYLLDLSVSRSEPDDFWQ